MNPGSNAVGVGGAKLNLATRVRYALDAAKGMTFLHNRQHASTPLLSHLPLPIPLLQEAYRRPGVVHSIIHRDLKSSNLLIANDQSKTVKICDFSFSRLSQGRYEITGVGLGTPGWVPPVRKTTLGKNSPYISIGWFVCRRRRWASW